MGKISKKVFVVLIIIITVTSTVFAVDKVENNFSAETEATAEVNIEDSNAANAIMNKMETILDPNNRELEQEVSETLEKHSDHWLVRFFKTIIDAIVGFIKAVFELATQAARIGVD